MLVVRSQKDLAGARFSSRIVFAHGAWMNVVVRSGLMFDTRYAPAARGAPRRGTCLLLLHRGRVTFPDLGSFEGPAALALTEQDVEGAHGERPRTYRAEGAPYAAVELHVRDEDAGPARAGEIPRALPLGDDAWEAVARVIDDARPSAEVAGAVCGMLDALAGAGLVAPAVASNAAAPLPFERLFRALGPLAERFALSATMDELGSIGRVSSRQLDRYIRDFFGVFPLVGGGFRAATVHLRLKLAVMFLSAEDATVTDVARAVGYGSTAALARAFRDAGLPAPGEVREALRTSSAA